MSNIKIELKEDYQEKLDVLRKVFVDEKGTELDNNGLIEGLVDTFLEFIQSQAKEGYEHSEEGGCCGGGSCETK
ncbi:MAG: hypothetical protein Q9M94_03820 [Candidatus Gracilibacteria bacterium]|nr:hypothetical protein [Candidatus Gracilibacteria bacterium]MDQ7022887.1 hypothetical protein [Candidatus Gracilibacteria bacterium]